MRIPIAVQLGLLVLVTALVGLAVLSIATVSSLIADHPSAPRLIDAVG
jgi:hypothetical protein